MDEATDAVETPEAEEVLPMDELEKEPTTPKEAIAAALEAMGGVKPGDRGEIAVAVGILERGLEL